MSEQVNAVSNEISQDYDLQNNSYYKHCWLPTRDLDHKKGNHWALMRKRGLQERDVDFLKRVMIANPRDRPTAKAILGSYWFQGGGLNGAKDDMEQVDGATDRLSISSGRSTAGHNGASDDFAVRPPVVSNRRHRLSDSPSNDPGVKRIRSLKSAAKPVPSEAADAKLVEPATLPPSAKHSIGVLSQADIEEMTATAPAQSGGQAESATLPPPKKHSIGIMSQAEIEAMTGNTQIPSAVGAETTTLSPLPPQNVAPSASTGGMYLNYR
jgi:hypothetical protein